MGAQIFEDENANSNLNLENVMQPQLKNLIMAAN